jgi:hypothetical protein
MAELVSEDYKKILEYYNEPIPKSLRLRKKNAERILANKLCRCIKKIDKVPEARSIGICTKTVINEKGYTRGKFKCKGRATIRLKKNNKTKRSRN